jgi:hypothetical protein
MESLAQIWIWLACHYRGWIETYWTPMREIFATGRISERTRARVKADKTERIERGQFRRKVTKAA